MNGPAMFWAAVCGGALLTIPPLLALVVWMELTRDLGDDETIWEGPQ